MAIFDPETKKFYCECGCGAEIPSWNSYVNGSHKINNVWTREERRRYGVSTQGGVLSHSEETKQRMSETHQAFWNSSEGRKAGDRLSEIHTGMVFSKEHKEAISRGVLRAYRDDPTYKDRTGGALAGRVRDEEFCEKVSKGQRKFLAGLSVKEMRRRMQHLLDGQHRPPSSTEIQLNKMFQDYLPGEWKYVGDGEVRIGRRNPDFININGKKAVIELMGDYWHEGEDEEDRISHYKEYGFNCLVVWAGGPEDIIHEWVNICTWSKSL